MKKNVVAVRALISAACFAVGGSLIADSPSRPPGLSCVDATRSLDGKTRTIECHLRLDNRGSEALFDAAVDLVDADGAVVSATRFDFGDVGSVEDVRAPLPLVYSFDWSTREPPKLKFELQFRDQLGEPHSRMLSLQ